VVFISVGQRNQINIILLKTSSHWAFFVLTVRVREYLLCTELESWEPKYTQEPNIAKLVGRD